MPEKQIPSNLACQSLHSNCFSRFLSLSLLAFHCPGFVQRTPCYANTKDSEDSECTLCFSPCVSVKSATECEKLLGQNRIQINLKYILGKSTRKTSHCHLDQQLCCVLKNTDLKTQSEARWELQEGKEDLCVSVRDCVCVGKGVKKKRRGQTLRIHSHRNEAHWQPNMIISFTTKSGCGGGVLKEDKYPGLTMTQNYEPADLLMISCTISWKNCSTFWLCFLSKS